MKSLLRWSLLLASTVFAFGFTSYGFSGVGGATESLPADSRYSSTVLFAFFWVALAILVAAQVGLVYALFHFRRRQNEDEMATQRGVRLDFILAIVPTILLVALVVVTYQRLTNLD